MDNSDMTEKIGVFGSAVDQGLGIGEKAHQLGEALADRRVIVITGASTGLPYQVALAAHQRGGVEIWGFSPALDRAGQDSDFPDNDNSIFTKFLYVPKDYEFVGNKAARLKYRNVSSTATCDGGIIVSGRWGTANEFTNLHDMGKVIGVLTGTGGFADELPTLYPRITKPSEAIVLFDNSPESLVDRVLEEIRKRQG